MIRKAFPSDAQAIAQVQIRSWQQAYRELMPAEFLKGLEATTAQREAFWGRSIESGESTVWVADLNGQVVGWISIGASRDDDGAGEDMAEVMALYVLADHWQTGVGLALWSAALRDLIDQGYRGLTLWVLAGNERAIQFYCKAGCAMDKGSERSLVRGGVTLVEVRYRLAFAR